MAMHLRAILTATEIFKGSSSMRTTSAASTAASEPMAPMAIPTSARARTGASFKPSPTKARKPSAAFVSCNKASARSTLSAGKRLPYTASSSNALPTLSPVVWLSPVSITSFFTPSLRNAFTASFECGFKASETATWPAYTPSTATWIIVPSHRQSGTTAPTDSIKRLLPTQTVFPLTDARIPLPGTSSPPSTLQPSPSAL